MDSAPLADDDFSFSFNSWVSNIVDTVNENFITIESGFNQFSVPSMTQLEITTAFGLGQLSNGMLIYCSDHGGSPCYVGVQNNLLVQFTTAAFP